MMTFIKTQDGNNLYTSDLNDKIHSFSKYCRACGCEVNILNNTGICWLSSDRKHHPDFRLLNKSVVTK